MSVSSRATVTLQISPGGDAGRRATMAQMLLDKGLGVSVRRHEGIAESDDPSARVAQIVSEVAVSASPLTWKPWFPVIDYTRCTNCMQCLSFCLFDVYGVSADKKIQVQNQSNCKTDCPACSRVCPEVAIMFPKYRHGPINGEE